MSFKVGFGALAAASADIKTGASKLEQSLATMDQSLQPLRANWTGEAANSYEAAKVKWTRAVTDLKVLLADVGRAVGTSGEDYENTEKTNTASW